MKKWLALGVLGVAGFAAFAGTCVISNTRMTTIGDKAVFAGQMKNETGADFLQHNFLVAFIDGSDLVETKSVEGCMRSLQADATNYFSATSTHDADQITAALSRLALDGTLKAGEAADGDLEITDLRIRRQGNQLRVTGKLKNNDNDRVYDPAVCVVVKDEDGKILIVQKNASISDLDEDEVADFVLNIVVLDDSNIVDSVSVFADGLAGSASGTPIEPASDENNNVENCGAPTNTPTATTTPVATNTPDPTITVTNTPTVTSTPCF